MRDSVIYKSTVSLGPEMKILRDEMKRQKVKKDGHMASGYEDRVIWAIEMLEKHLSKYNYDVRTDYHRDWRHKKTSGAKTPAELYDERMVRIGFEEDTISGDMMRDE